MKVSEAIELLSQLDPDADMMFDGSRGIGNLIEIFHAWPDEYSSFAQPLPCVILSDRSQEERTQALDAPGRQAIGDVVGDNKHNHT